ncbi:hypothetical protein [Albidovulum sp.]|jgi:hypothetical protein|uniref:hypothetical protein n=1 Tax=Albidovulum sp. TaxID=1872424 RepID=UPI00303F385A
MQDIALRGLVADGRAEDFDSFGWFQPFGLDTQGVFELLPKALQEAQQVDPGYVAERHATRPLDPSEPEGELLVWPTRNSGLTLLLAKEAGEWAMTGCWPFLTSGSEHDAEIERVVLAPDRLRAMIEARIGGELALTYHDYTFAARRGLYVKGFDHRLVLAGIAHFFGPADTTPVKLGPDAPSFAALSKGGAAVGEDGMVTIETRGMAAIFPREAIAPNAYEVRGPVVRVRKPSTRCSASPSGWCKSPSRGSATTTMWT